MADPEKRTQYLKIIALESERLSRLINNVLDFARMERHRQPLEQKPIDLFPVVRRSWEAQEAHLKSQGFQTAWERDTEPPYPVSGNEDALAQILVNLVSNAEKYSPRIKQVTLRTGVHAGEVRVSVLDRGLGVPEGQGRKIFEPFHRAHDSLSSGIQGSGLGLTIAQRLAAEHGGTIDYRPRAGGGSEFTLRLPLAGRTAAA
jgi:signal transduction histidine kinase